MVLTTRIHGDLSDAEIERRYQLAFHDIRRGGTGDIARSQERVEEGLKSGVVLRVLHATGDSTIGDLARTLGRPAQSVWGHMCFLRKCQKVEVKRWVTSVKGRKMAVYGVKT